MEDFVKNIIEARDALQIALQIVEKRTVDENGNIFDEHGNSLGKSWQWLKEHPEYKKE